MASLTGQTIASTYDALLKITDNGPITVSLKQITDGLGNNTPLYLSATTVFVDGNFRLSGPLYDTNNNPGTNGQILVSTGSAVDWQNLSESGLITGSGTATFIPKFTSSSAIGSSIISESVSGIGIGITATQKLHVDGNGLFTGTLTASNVSGSTSGTNTGDETNASIKTKLGQVSAIQDGYLSSVDYESFTNKVPNTRTITINGETFDLSANRTYSVNVGVTSFNTRTGAVVLSSGDVTTALGYTPALNSRIMTINGVGYDLSADRSWSVGTVTSVGTSAPLTGGTITGSGTIGITQSGASADGYLSSTDWNTFNNKQAALGYTPENVANKGVANGYASLDGAGKVPSTQLPSYVDDVVEVANYAALPATGETGKIYITLDTNFVYRWSGSVYVKISEPNAVWGSITGTLSNQTDLQNALNAKVDNTRTLTINGTEYDLSANRSWNVGTVTSVSGTGTVSGLSLSGSVTGSGNLTLGGTLALTSSDVTTGLGYTPVTNVRTLSINGTSYDLTANRSWSVGTVTSVGLALGTTGTDVSVSNSPITSSGDITLNIPTASATNRGALSSTDWSTFNNKQNALTLTTTGNSGSATLVGATLNIPTYTLAGLGGQPLLTNPVTGTGTSGYLTRFTGSTTVGNSVIYDNGSQIGIGNAAPSVRLDVTGDIKSSGVMLAGGATSIDSNLAVQISSSGTGTQKWIGVNKNNSYGLIIGYNESSGTLAGVGAYIRQITGDPIHFVVNNTTTAMSLISNGNLLLNNTGYTTAGKLAIQGDNNSNTVYVKGGSTTGQSYGVHVAAGTNSSDYSFLVTNWSETANYLRVRGDGNVGIGTSSPGNKLTILQGGIELIADQSGGGYGSLMGMEFDGGDAYNFTISTRKNSGTFTKSLTITGDSGAVGIQTSNPNTQLHVAGSLTVNDVVYLQRSSSSLFLPVMNYWNGSGANPLNGTKGDILAIGNAGGDGVVFANANAEQMRLTSTGLGIGTSSPSVLLHCNPSSGANTVAALFTAGASDANFKAGFANGSGGAVNSEQAKMGMWYGTSGNPAAHLGFLRDNSAGSLGITFNVNNSERMRITSGGRVLIGKTSDALTANGVMIYGTSGNSGELFSSIVNSTNTLHVWDTNNSTYRFYVSGSGTVFATNTTISALSDIRLKENIRDIDNALSKIMMLKPRVFDWKDGAGKGIKNDRGFIAQEFEEVFPDLIDEFKVSEKESDEKYKSVRQDLIPILVKAIQEQQAQIEELKAKLK